MYIESGEYWLFDDIQAIGNLTTGRLEELIALISREIDEYCNTRFEPTEDFYTLDLCEGFYTHRRPLLEVAELSLRGTVLVPGADYFVYPEFSRVELAVSQTVGVRKALAVRYNYGYMAVPATVKGVIVDLIKLDAESKSVSMQGMQSESWDSEYSYTRITSKDYTPAELRRNILSRLDALKAAPHEQPREPRVVRARLI